jgi:hypothetical protein
VSVPAVIDGTCELDIPSAVNSSISRARDATVPRMSPSDSSISSTDARRHAVSSSSSSIAWRCVEWSEAMTGKATSMAKNWRSDTIQATNFGWLDKTACTRQLGRWCLHHKQFKQKVGLMRQPIVHEVLWSLYADVNVNLESH